MFIRNSNFIFFIFSYMGVPCGGAKVQNMGKISKFSNFLKFVNTKSVRIAYCIQKMKSTYSNKQNEPLIKTIASKLAILQGNN